MNEAWREPEREAHEAKAEALRLALEQVSGVRGFVDNVTDGMIAQLDIALRRQIEAHEQAARLVGTR